LTIVAYWQFGTDGKKKYINNQQGTHFFQWQERKKTLLLMANKNHLNHKRNPKSSGKFLYSKSVLGWFKPLTF
jgi:hypothetical protein